VVIGELIGAHRAAGSIPRFGLLAFAGRCRSVPERWATIRQWSRELALGLQVTGLINLQFAVQLDARGAEQVFIIEANSPAPHGRCRSGQGHRVPLAKTSRPADGRPHAVARAGLPRSPRPPLRRTSRRRCCRSSAFPRR